MTGADGTKADLRRLVRAARRALAPEARTQASRATCDALLRMLRSRSATVLAGYAALPDELNLDLLLEAWRSGGGSVLLPRVAGPGRLAWHRVDGPGLRPGAYGIREPDPALCPEEALPHAGVIIVPGVAFTRDGDRLGQGGGFYDRLLAGRRDLCCIGAGFACQLLPALPIEAHDRRLDGLVIDGATVIAPPGA